MKGHLIGLLPVAALGVILYTVDRAVETRVRSYSENVLPVLMKQQEEKLGIKHVGQPEVKRKFLLNSLAMYDPNTNTFYYSYLDALTKATAKYEPYSYLQSDLNRTSHHELGHFHKDQIGERLGLTKWFVDDSNIINFGRKIITEGIGEYFERKMMGGDDVFDDNEYPEDVDSLLIGDEEAFNHVVYNGGYHLVGPILDKGIDKGIELLLQNPPTEDDVTGLPAYRSRMLRELERRLLK